MPAIPRASVAVPATRKDLRKERLRCWYWTLSGRRGAAPRRGLITTRQTRKGFAATVADFDACRWSQHRGSTVSAQPPLDQRRLAAHGSAGRISRPGGVLGLLPRQLAAHAALSEGLARALRRRWSADHRRSHRRVRPGAGRGQRSPRGRAARDPLGGRHRHRARGLGPLRQPGLARALPVGPGPLAVLAALRRGRLRRDRARDPAAARASRASRWTRCAPRTPRTR